MYCCTSSGHEDLSSTKVLYIQYTYISIQYIITGIDSLIPLLGAKIIHLVDRTDLFKISNLV